MDIAIVIFTIYNVLICAKKGLIKSAFISVGFVVKVVLTYIIYVNYADVMLKNQQINYFVASTKVFFIENLPAIGLLYDKTDGFVLCIGLFILLSAVLTALYVILKKILLSPKDLNAGDIIFGGIFGFIKATLVIMLMVYVIDMIPHNIITKGVREFISHSVLITPYYTYNIFMNFFGV